MAVLVGGQTWGLTGSTSSKSNYFDTNIKNDHQQHHHSGPREHKTSKSVILVKLTDASLKAIEEFVKNEARLSSSAKPTIQFPSGSNDSGSIRIPLGRDGQSAEFAFSLSAESTQGPKGSFECISSEKPGTLQSIGNVQEKLHVQASDETYTRFEQHMAEVKKENEKRTTQFLDRRPPGSASFVRKFPKTQNSHVSNNSSKHHSNDISSSSSAISSFKSASRPNPTPASTTNFLSGTHPMLERRTNKSPPANPDLMRRPLKERIIHLLAVRPYKKPELLLRITRDGILEKDRKNISIILKQVSVMKDNTYHLLRHIWNDVSEDWPFYSEQERQSFRRRKPQNLTPPCSDGSTSSSGHSPSSTHPASPPSGTSRIISDGRSPSKRSSSSYFGSQNGLSDDCTSAAKKKRVSNYVRPPDMKMTPNSSANYNNKSGLYGSNSDLLSCGSPAGSMKGEGNSPLPNNVMSGMPTKSPYLGRSPELGSHLSANSPCYNEHQHHSQTVIPETTGQSLSSPLWPQHQRQEEPSGDRIDNQKKTSVSSKPSPQPNNNSVACSSPMVNNDKSFLTQYTTISNREQRAAYKKDFADDYTRYRELHAKLEKVSKRFAQLEERLKQEQPGTESFMKLKAKIFREYQENKQNPKYMESRREFQFLHEKLAHIKKLVHEYDTRNAS